VLLSLSHSGQVGRHLRNYDHWLRQRDQSGGWSDGEARAVRLGT
jgi:hypothetical protein